MLVCELGLRTPLFQWYFMHCRACRYTISSDILYLLTCSGHKITVLQRAQRRAFFGGGM